MLRCISSGPRRAEERRETCHRLPRAAASGSVVDDNGPRPHKACDRSLPVSTIRMTICGCSDRHDRASPHAPAQLGTMRSEERTVYAPGVSIQMPCGGPLCP
eukprot:6212921-Prymnesium_polylepis.1